MKKIKILKKRHKRRKKKKNFVLNYKLKCLITILLIVIISALLIIMFIVIKGKLDTKIYEVEKYESDIIKYKGEKYQKKKLIEDYLSQVPGNNRAKAEEKYIINIFFLYLDKYTNNPKIKINIKNKLMERLSQKKGKHVNKIDTFFVEHIHNLGNMLVEINNIIFYCEVIGCNKIILKDHDLSRQWLLKKPVYIKKLNITIMTGPDVNCDDDNIYCVIEQIWDPYYPKIV